MKYQCAIFKKELDSSDTYASKITSAIMWWCNPTDDPTQLLENIDVGYTQSTGGFTFYPAEDNRTGDLYILARS